MSDRFFDTEFGTTVMGHLNLISGQTHQTGVDSVPGKIAHGSVIANVEAGFDDCTGAVPTKMTSQNVGDLLNANSVTWG
jgi:phospholipase C